MAIALAPPVAQLAANLPEVKSRSPPEFLHPLLCVANQTAEQAWAQVQNGNDRLRRGVRPEAVTFLQGMLQGLGYPLTVDGELGPKTEAAIAAFQEANGLEPDGVVGPATAAAITTAFEAL